MSCPESSEGNGRAAGAVNQAPGTRAGRTSVWGRHLSLTPAAAGEQLGQPIRASPSTAGQGTRKRGAIWNGGWTTKGQTRRNVDTRQESTGLPAAPVSTMTSAFGLNLSIKRTWCFVRADFTELDGTLMALHPFLSHTLIQIFQIVITRIR